MGSTLANTKHSIFLTYCHEIVGVAMKWLLEKHFPKSTIGEAQNFKKTLRDLPKKEYDLVVLDAEMEDSTHVLGTVEHIKSLCPKTRILIFSELDESIYASKYIAFGTNGYVAKTADISNILSAIEVVLSGGIFHGETNESNADLVTTEELKTINPFDSLSKREAEIADLLIRGDSLTDISKGMNLKETTISTYKKRVFKKAKVKTLSDLIKLKEIYQ